MLKMKSALYIVAIFALALVACTERLDVKDVPTDYNGNGATTMSTIDAPPVKLLARYTSAIHKIFRVRGFNFTTSPVVRPAYIYFPSQVGF